MATRKKEKCLTGAYIMVFLLLNEDHLKWYAFKILCILLHFTEIWFYIVDDFVLDLMSASYSYAFKFYIAIYKKNNY